MLIQPDQFEFAIVVKKVQIVVLNPLPVHFSLPFRGVNLAQICLRVQVLAGQPPRFHPAAQGRLPHRQHLRYRNLGQVKLAGAVAAHHFSLCLWLKGHSSTPDGRLSKLEQKCVAEIEEWEYRNGCK
jgi:hypothetical protein